MSARPVEARAKTVRINEENFILSSFTLEEAKDQDFGRGGRRERKGI